MDYFYYSEHTNKSIFPFYPFEFLLDIHPDDPVALPTVHGISLPSPILPAADPVWLRSIVHGLVDGSPLNHIPSGS